MTTSRLRAQIKQGRPFESPSEEAAVALLRATDQLERRLSATVEAAGITRQQYNVLRILRGSAPAALPTLEIAVRMVEQAPGVTRLLDRLEAKRLVTRERCHDDRRQVLCRISAPGLELLGELDRPVRKAIREVFRALGDEGARELVRLLDALLEGLTETAATPRKETS